jgi:hypothetical protein
MHADHRLVLVVSASGTRYLLWVDLVDDVLAQVSSGSPALAAQQPDSVVSHVARLHDAILPVLSPTTFEPRPVA